MKNAGNLSSRIGRLEHTLGLLPCTCTDNADLSSPGHDPTPHCPTCGGQRLIYPLAHHPGPAEALLRQALPVFRKAYGNGNRADLSKLSDHELQQLKQALRALEHAHNRQRERSASRRPDTEIDFENRCSIH